MENEQKLSYKDSHQECLIGVIILFGILSLKSPSALQTSVDDSLLSVSSVCTQIDLLRSVVSHPTLVQMTNVKIC